MPTINKFIFPALVVVALMPVVAIGQSYPNQGYLVDSEGRFVGSGTPGQCWHTSEWTPALAVEPCDPVIQRMSAAPVEQIVQAAPAPIAPPVVVTPQLQRVSFSADALFAFDKSVLQPEGKTMLDDLVSQLKGITYESIELTGHADRIGRAEYNQALSERRANEVKSYLIEKGIPADRILARGLGETQPVTQLADCTGPVNAKLRACLQPDRRVDVEVKGTISPDNAP